MSYLKALWIVVLVAQFSSSSAFLKPGCFSNSKELLCCRSVRKAHAFYRGHRLVESLRSTMDDQDPASVQISVATSSESTESFSSSKKDKDINWMLFGIAGVVSLLKRSVSFYQTITFLVFFCGDRISVHWTHYLKFIIKISSVGYRDSPPNLYEHGTRGSSFNKLNSSCNGRHQ